MTSVFDLYLHQQLAGNLTFDEKQRISFRYIDEYMAADLPPISFNMPLPKAGDDLVFQDDDLLPFLENLFPEGDIAQKIRSQNKIADQDFRSLVELMGGDVAGAIVIVPHGHPPNDDKQERKLSLAELSKMLIGTKDNPYNLNTEHQRRLSLAGAQNKLPVVIRDGHISIPGSNPSTHILKPEPEKREFQYLVYNEYACMRVAKLLGINTAEVSLVDVLDSEGIESSCLAVTRYDRVFEGGSCDRIHQEDFCQLQKMLSSQKYQFESNLGIGDLMAFISRNTDVPALSKLECIKIILLNIVIGNKDAHAKNFSFLHVGGGKLRLAPAYDLVCTEVFEDLDKRMAMPIGDERFVSKLTTHDFDVMADLVGMKASYIIKILAGFTRKIPSLFDQVILELQEMDEFEDRVDHVRLVKACALDNIRMLTESGIIDQ